MRFHDHATPWWLSILGVLAWIGFWVGRKNRTVVFFALLSVLGILVSKQVAEPWGNLYYYLYDHLPGFNAFREPTTDNGNGSLRLCEESSTKQSGEGGQRERILPSRGGLAQTDGTGISKESLSLSHLSPRLYAETSACRLKSEPFGGTPF